MWPPRPLRAPLEMRLVLAPLRSQSRPLIAPLEMRSVLAPPRSLVLLRPWTPWLRILVRAPLEMRLLRATLLMTMRLLLVSARPLQLRQLKLVL